MTGCAIFFAGAHTELGKAHRNGTGSKRNGARSLAAGSRFAVQRVQPADFRGGGGAQPLRAEHARVGAELEQPAPEGGADDDVGADGKPILSGALDGHVAPEAVEHRADQMAGKFQPRQQLFSAEHREKPLRIVGDGKAFPAFVRFAVFPEVDIIHAVDAEVGDRAVARVIGDHIIVVVVPAKRVGRRRICLAAAAVAFFLGKRIVEIAERHLARFADGVVDAVDVVVDLLVDVLSAVEDINLPVDASGGLGVGQRGDLADQLLRFFFGDKFYFLEIMERTAIADVKLLIL